ncbi:MAG: sn-glycerol-1-phosphate dehydrogenase [Ruminococcaceae bacterium]|nr:sn-glycerol-1-phosphate dehydrogenase [Oscillospiraceae bacterium]
MDINSILNGIKCDCGKKHNCSIEKVYIESGAIKRLTRLCSDYNNILLVADGNTFSAAGAEVENALTDKILKKVIFSGEKLLIPDEIAIEEVNKKVSEAELIIGIGSGVIQDLCKYVSFFSKVPYIIVATAPSMDGYASDGAAMILGGMKETVKAGLPKAIIADIDVLKNAPMEMIKAGYGDIVGKYSALCDWKLSAAVTGEYFCRYIYDTTFQMIEHTLETAQGLLERKEESIKILTEALMIVGIMMSFAGTSRPASGSEHHLSHFFEIVGIVNSEPYFPHGIDVAYSTIVTAKLREKIVNSDFPDTIYRLSEDEYKEKMNKIYKSVSEGCMSLQNRIGNYSKDRMQTYKQKEGEIRNILSQMPKSEDVEKMLSVVGLDVEEFYKLYDKQKIQNAILYAKDLKDRYTVLWLYYDLFGDRIEID